MGPRRDYALVARRAREALASLGALRAKAELRPDALRVRAREPAAERPAELGRRAEARLRIAREGALDDRPERPVDSVAGERGTLGSEGALALVHRARLERAPSGQRLEEHRAEREDVARRLHPPRELLGREVPRRAEDLRVLVAERRRDPEVEQAAVPVGVDDHVPRRHVAVHDVEARVRVVERAGDLHAEVRGEPRRELSVPQDRAQRRALHVLHREEVHAVDHAELEDRRDVRVAHLHERLRLLHEHRDEARIGRELRQDLLHHQPLLEPAHAAQPRGEDARHSASRDLLVEEVLAEGADHRGRAAPWRNARAGAPLAPLCRCRHAS